MGQDYAYLIAAQVGAEQAELAVDFVNRGISGNRVLDLAARWQTDTLDLHPQVLSILIGVNDTLSTGDKAETVEQFEATYDRLLADTVSALPKTRIVLGEPFLLPVGKHVDTYTTEFAEVKKRQAVVAKLAAKYHLPEVMYQQVFDAAVKRAPAAQWCWDGVHPTYAGHWLMAQEWLRVTSAAWTK